MIIKRIFSLLLIFSFGLLSGCGGKKLPDGMPKLYPVSISVTQEGKPLADASISFRYPNNSAPWAVGGQTDTAGKAKLYTNGYPGAPLGQFNVVIFKQDNVGLKERGEAEGRLDPDAGKIKVRIWSCVEPQYNDPNKTPIHVEITEKTKTVDIDAGPAVQIEQPFVP